jgi:hypothetical protein
LESRKKFGAQRNQTVASPELLHARIEPELSKDEKIGIHRPTW